MASTQLLTEEELRALRQFDTCMIANAIEKFNVRLRSEIDSEVPNVATKLQRSEQEVIEFCKSKDFSIEKLRALMKKGAVGVEVGMDKSEILSCRETGE